MSSHSRSSSEVEIGTPRDVLSKSLKDFVKDFSLGDVDIRHIFNEEQMQNIREQPTEEKKILQLFWILQDNEQLITPFLNQIEEWYPWLTQQVNDELSISKEKDQYYYALQNLRMNFQKHIDLNIHRMKFYWPVRLALLKLKPYNFLVLSGELGIGKKWILLDVCSEYEVMKTMGFNIFWLDVYKCNRKEDDFRALQKLQLLIGEADSTSACRHSSEFDGIENKILHLQQCIRDRLKQDKFKNCLLVLSGVQNSKTWKNLNLGCKIVIITRNQKIIENLSESTAKHIPIDSGFTVPECYQYFEKVLKRSYKTFPKSAFAIFSLSNGQPCLLSIIANNLKMSKRQNWIEWKKNLENLEIPDKLTMVVEISLNVLQAEQIELYKTLSIFPHSVEIPLKLVASLWGKNERESENHLETFYKYSIINRNDMPDESVAYILPYIYSLYLKTLDQTVDQTNLHNRIVNYYRINEILESRRDEEFSFCNDYYFYHCIGYHLKASNNLDLFPKLFLDFLFLGEKLRSDGFPNTVADLKHFEKEITGNDLRRQKLLAEILKFLPHAETVLFHSKDTNLLQYALMADGLLRDEAIKQARLFERRVWFEDKGHFHQRRQIVRLPQKIQMVKSVAADMCVIALKTNDILLVDLSLDYNNEPVYLTGNQYPILKMELFMHDNFIITLDVKGNLKVWSLVDDDRRSACFERKVNPLNLMKSPEMQKRRCKQLLEKSIRGPIKAFHIELLQNYKIDLHLAFGNGDICIYSWDVQCEEFKIKSVPILPTKMRNICYFSKVLNLYYMVLNVAGDIYFFNLCDSSQTAHSFEWPKPINLIYVGEYKREKMKIIIFVYPEKVLYLSFLPQKFKLLEGELKTVYNINDHDSENWINCARMSRDGSYLILGTKHGLIVFNVESQSEVLRGNISESIASVDVYPLDDNLYKYLVICASEQSNVLNLFALKELENKTIAWSYRLSNLTGTNADGNIPQLEPDVWLQGKKLFDLNHKDRSLLVAVDSKNRIHQVSTTNEKSWSISMPTRTASKITAITIFDQTTLCSFDDGTIFNISTGLFVQSIIRGSISYLQMINDKIFVVSSEIEQKSAFQHLENHEISKTFDIPFFKSFILFETYVVMISSLGRFIVIDLFNNFKVLHDMKDTNGEVLGGCDLKENCLVLVTSDLIILIYKFHLCDGNLTVNYCKPNTKAMHLDYNDVTCVASSFDASLLAVGMQNGVIEIYQLESNEIKFIFRLSSHTSQIYDLKFSPNTEVLVSCSEQLCFWSVPFMLNNPFDSGTRKNRHSSRFRSSNSQEDVIIPLVSQNDGLTTKIAYPWSNKPSPVVLLSCIKFVGNKAEIFFANHDFTNFYTIDNEGVYYQLCVHEISRKRKKTATNDRYYDDDEVIT